MPSLREELISKGLVKPQTSVDPKEESIRKVLESAFLALINNEPTKVREPKKATQAKQKSSSSKTKTVIQKNEIQSNLPPQIKASQSTDRERIDNKKKAKALRRGIKPPPTAEEIKRIQRNLFKPCITICVVCGEAVPPGKMLEHKQTKHAERMYAPSPAKPRNGNIYAKVFQGGLPSLGKRSK